MKIDVRCCLIFSIARPRTRKTMVPYLPTSLDYHARFHSPRLGHLLGTDQIGRDVLSGMIHGTRTALAVWLISMGIAIIIGLILGAFAGYYGGLLDIIVQRIIEVMKPNIKVQING